MSTLPRLCLVGFGDYKQKDGDVNTVSRLWRLLAPVLFVVGSLLVRGRFAGSVLVLYLSCTEPTY
jgi:hypothetical protein